MAATVAVCSFRSSATPDQTLSFRINRPGNLREQLRTGLVSQSATAVHQLAAGALTPNRSGVKAHANNLPHSVYIDPSSPLQAASGWSKPSLHTGGPGSRGGCHCVLAERMPAKLASQKPRVRSRLPHSATRCAGATAGGAAFAGTNEPTSLGFGERRVRAQRL